MVSRLREIKKLKNNQAFVVFLLFFLIYTILGLYISYGLISQKNLFFGADNARAYSDIVVIVGEHYRIKVHPLFLLLVQPIVLFIDGVVNRPNMSVIIAESLMGAGTVALLYLILEKLNIKRILKLLFVGLIGFSFSNMLFSAIPETYIFSAFVLVAWWCYILHIGEEGNLDKRALFVIMFFGMACFGITLTNYISYLIGLVYLVIKKMSVNKKSIWLFIKINILNSITIFVACIAQKLIWKSSPFFGTSIYESFIKKTQDYEELQYMDWGIGVEKTLEYVKQIFIYPLMSSKPYLGYTDRGTEVILFGGFDNLIAKLAITAFLLVCMTVIIFSIYKLAKKNNIIASYCIAVVCALGANILLHYIYGAHEAFIYSQHYLFLFVIVVCVAFNSIENKIIRRISYSFLAVFLIVQIINNLIQFKRTLEIFMGIFSMQYSLLNAVKGAFLCVVVVCVISLIIHRKLMGKKEALAPTLVLSKILYKYLLIIGIAGMFIAFNY